MVTRDYILPPSPVDGDERTAADGRRVRDLIFDQAPMGMALVATSGLILRVNTLAAEIVGRPPAALAGVTLRDVVHPADRDGVMAQLDALVAGTSTYLRAETRLVHGDGRRIWVSVHASCVREVDGSPQLVLAQIEDVTAERTAAAALAQAEELFRTTFEMAPIGMIVTDTAGVLLRVNPAYGHIGRSSIPAELVGLTINTVTHPDDRDFTTAQVKTF